MARGRQTWHNQGSTRHIVLNDGKIAVEDVQSVQPSASPPPRKKQKVQHEPVLRPPPWRPQNFYESVHVPPSDGLSLDGLQSDDVNCILLPFQKRAVKWLLSREGVSELDSLKSSVVPTDELDTHPPPGFKVTQDENGHSIWSSHACNLKTKERAVVANYSLQFPGGILAEEMGLGKTIELMSLICLHKRANVSEKVFDKYSDTEVTASGATLVVTPPHILQQWINELETHAPSLKVLHYSGVTRLGKEELKYTDLLDYDVVLTTYAVLAKEIHFVKDPPERSRRFERKYERRRSPLVQISWWRVCLDEAQLIESGVSKAAIVARLIPRINAWAVTGTPVKQNIKDLRGLLVFLRYEPFGSNDKAWAALQTSDPTAFHRIFNTIAIRHSKSHVRGELQLPPQKRVVLTLPFSAIEEQHYAEFVQAMCDDCAFTPEGGPLDQYYDPNSTALHEKMRSWLRVLRQTCLHAQISRQTRKKLGGEAPLRTVAQVLESMIDSNETALHHQQRMMIDAYLNKGHVYAFARDVSNRAQRALEYYLAALKEVDGLVAECRSTLAELSKSAADDRNVIKEPSGEDVTDDSTNEDEDPLDKADKRSGRLTAAQTSLRLSLVAKHACVFFIASAYFQLKELATTDDEKARLDKLEVDTYESAKAIREELLMEPKRRSERASNKLVKSKTTGKLSKIEEIEQLEDLGGIENKKFLDECDEVVHRLNVQVALICQWRAKVLDTLQKPLVDQDNGQETTGGEYEDSTKVQDELYVYTMFLRVMIADHSATLTGQINIRTTSELKHQMTLINDPTKKKRSQRLTAFGEEPLAEEARVHCPELFKELNEKRKPIEPTDKDPSLRSIIAQLRDMASDFRLQTKRPTDRAAMELGIVERQMKDIQAIITLHIKLVMDLEQEQEAFHHAMNQRVEFYRQLQVISDTVQPYKEEMTDGVDQTELSLIESAGMKAKVQVETLRTKRRFLLHLRNEAEDPTETRTCVICRDEFEDGVLTVCGHQYCKECIGMWWSAHRSCPVCKRILKTTDFHDITYKPQEIRITEESSQNKQLSESTSSTPTDGTIGRGNQPKLYSSVDSTMMTEIKSIDLPGSYGTKIDTLSRHLIWLRNTDPGAKSIVFSQSAEFLEILSAALSQFKIGHTSIKQNKGIERFRQDPTIECFLLDAKSDSSGLNLVNATHVFLCEPLINTALELQAIARVHRIGQTRPTTVYMYIVRDTVEEAVYDISVKRRMEHIATRTQIKARSDVIDLTGSSPRKTSKGKGKASPPHDSGVEILDNEKAIEDADSRELQTTSLGTLLVKGAKGKGGGGEIVRDKDLWNCLFLHPRIPQKNIIGDIARAARGQTEGTALEFQREFAGEERAQAADRRRDEMA